MGLQTTTQEKKGGGVARPKDRVLAGTLEGVSNEVSCHTCPYSIKPMCSGLTEPMCSGLTEPMCSGLTEPMCSGLIEPMCSGLITLIEPMCSGLTEPMCSGLFMHPRPPGRHMGIDG